MEEKKIPRRASKKEHIAILLKRLDDYQKEGDTITEALEKLTLKQYDFLIDCGVNLDNLILTTEQQKAITSITKAPRICKDGGYSKDYPKAKIDLYLTIKSHLEKSGAIIKAREKENFRDLDFTLDNIAYKIVLSNPRLKKL